ncbi:MAG: response regulator [Planctomycetia bacterium]|nr:response regulator [Planctomycetia bacterium]
MSEPLLRVAVIDDSALYRQMLLNVLGRLPGVEVVGMATNGVEGVALVARTRPDVVTLDVQMPEMDGIEVLREFRRRGLTARTIMVSSLTSEGAPATVAALMEGAIDYVLKPAGSFAHENREQLLADLAAKLAVVRAATATRPAAPEPPSVLPNRFHTTSCGRRSISLSISLLARRLRPVCESLSRAPTRCPICRRGKGTINEERTS